MVKFNVIAQEVLKITCIVPAPSHTPTGPAKVLPMKNLTLSGSLTFPTNL